MPRRRLTACRHDELRSRGHEASIAANRPWDACKQPSRLRHLPRLPRSPFHLGVHEATDNAVQDYEPMPAFRVRMQRSSLSGRVSISLIVSPCPGLMVSAHAHVLTRQVLWSSPLSLLGWGKLSRECPLTRTHLRGLGAGFGSSPGSFHSRDHPARPTTEVPGACGRRAAYAHFSCFRAFIAHTPVLFGPVTPRIQRYRRMPRLAS